METHPLDLEVVYHEQGPGLWTYLRKRVSDLAVAEELFQETFLMVAGNPAPFAAARSQKAWLIGIARNLLMEHYRRRRQEQALDPTRLRLEERQPAPDARIDAMRAAIGRLPAAQREVLELRLRDELSYAEIAAVLEVPIGTVRSRLHSAVAALKAWAAEVDPQAGRRCRDDRLAQPAPEVGE